MKDRFLASLTVLTASILFAVPAVRALRFTTAQSFAVTESGAFQAGHVSGASCPTDACSLNWGGYAVTSTSGSVTDVKASFVIPTVSCSSKNAFASFWVGIDGATSSTVEQTGITANPCNTLLAPPGYSVWYEFYPDAPFYASFAAAAGESVTAEVKYVPSTGVFTTIITVKSESTVVGTLTHSQTVPGALSDSAEWIAEAPSLGGRVLPLANFGTMSFTSSSATIGGKTGSISAAFPSSSIHEITMTSRTYLVKALPSSLASLGASFTVTWAHK